MLSNNSKHGQAGIIYIYILFAVIAFLVGIAGYIKITSTFKKIDLTNLKHATSLHNNPRTFPAFNLVDHNGREYTNSNLTDSWYFVFFGFTHCPDVCPLSLSTLDQVISTITTNDSIYAQAVFISVDPNRDTPQKLEKYVQHFNNKTIGLTGNDKQLKLLTQSLGVVYTSPKSDDEENYLIDHSAQIFLVAPNGNLVALFSTPHEHRTIVDDFIILNNYYNSLQGSE